MSGSNWGVRVTVIVALAALTFTTLGTGAFFGGLYAPHYGDEAERSAYRSANAKQDNPSQIDRDRAGLPYFAERIASDPDPRDGTEREKRDLAAQESMSVWAFWMLLVSAAGVITTMVGTGFLLWQIILTRRAVEDTGEATVAMREANRIAAHTQRPWIKISGELLGFKIHERRAITFDISVTFENVGQMVAENFYAFVKLVPMGEPFLAHMKEWYDKFELEEGLQARDTAVIPGGDYLYRVQANQAIEYLPWCTQPHCRKDCYFMVLAMSRYRIPGEVTWRYAMKGFSIGEHISHVDNRHLIYDSIRELTPDKIVLQAMGRSRAT